MTCAHSGAVYRQITLTSCCESCRKIVESSTIGNQKDIKATALLKLYVRFKTCLQRRQF